MKTQINTDRMIWCDVETFGLVPALCPIIELGFVITDIELNVIDDFQTTVWSSPEYDERLETLSNEYVFQMHTSSGLWKEARSNGLSPEEANFDLCHWLDGHGVGKGDALCGSSILFDRRMLEQWFPEAIEKFSYRNIDISSVKELCARYNPRVYSKLDEYSSRQEKHRVLPDIEDTIGELKFYVDNFLFII